MAVPYTSTGRVRQKERTRDALVAATRELLARGVSPRVEDAAAEAGISRTTAYRYYPNQRALLLAAHPEIEHRSLLPPDPPADPQARLDLTIRAFIRLTIDWEPQLRTQLRLSLEPEADQPALRQGRAIDWIEDAIAPVKQNHPHVDTRRLAIAIRSATGVESLVWLTDIARLNRTEAAEVMRQSAHAILRATIDTRAEA